MAGKDPENNGTNEVRDVIVNEVLCYVTNNIHSCTKEQVTKAVYRFYDIEEIVNAKKVLFDQNITFTEVKKLSNEYAAHSSFKLEVPVAMAARVMEPDVWPEGVFIRKFEQRYPRR
jgi:hypothetical protein